MQLEHLQLFLRISEVKSISKVALAQHISQPALSLQMQKLEDALGCKLFERSNRGIELTREGELTERYARQITETYDVFREELLNMRSNSAAFRIAASRVAADYAIPCLMAKAKEKYPACNLTLSSMPSKDVIRAVLSDRAVVGFIVGDTDDPQLTSKNVFSDQIMLVAGVDYPIREDVSIEALKKKPMVLLDESFSSYRLLASQLASLGHAIEMFNVRYHMNSTEAVKSMIMDGSGIGFLPYIAIKKEIYLNQLKIVDIKSLNLRYDCSIIYKKATEAQDAMLETMRKYLISIAPEALC